MEQKSWDFSNSKAATELELTLPGTIGIFDISKVEFGESKDKKTPFMKLHFASKKVKEKNAAGAEVWIDLKTTFNHSFYLTGGAMDRIQYLHKVLHDSEMTGSINEATLTAKFLNKELALKVTGQVADNGKGYPNLEYAGFAKKTADVEQLRFSTADLKKIEAAITAIVEGSVNKADKETGAGSGTPAPSPTGGGF